MSTGNAFASFVRSSCGGLIRNLAETLETRLAVVDPGGRVRLHGVKRVEEYLSRVAHVGKPHLAVQVEMVAWVVAVLAVDVARAIPAATRRADVNGISRCHR